MQYFHTYESPLGNMLLLANERALTGLYFVAQRYYPTWDPGWVAGATVEIIEQASAELSQYFAGERTKFDTPLEFRGTPFQRKVWAAISDVGCGEIISYAELAQRCGCVNSVRAVGAATGRNRISIIVPCHRIVGSNGKLTGYAGGLDKKQSLLIREGALH
jgi:methylated-DNA-[protein]-cysteine S-methyltransferase